MLRYTTLHYATLRYTTLHEFQLLLQLQLQLHYSTRHCTTSHYTTLITPHHNYNCKYITLQLQLRYTTTTITTATTAALHHTTSSCCGWPPQPLQPLQKTQLQLPFSPSVDSLCHPCITTTHLSYNVLSLKLPPPPCAVLLVADKKIMVRRSQKWYNVP